MDHLRRELKRMIAADRRRKNVDQAAGWAEAWLPGPSPTEAGRKAGVLSDDFGLKGFV